MRSTGPTWDLLVKAQLAGPDAQTMPLEKYNSHEAWLNHLEQHREIHNGRRRFEQDVLARNTGGPQPGWCGLCERPSDFALSAASAGFTPNLREELVCLHCGMNARVRAALQIAKAQVDLDNARVYITEQASPTYVWLQRNLKHVVGSEFCKDESSLQHMQQYLVELGGSGEIRFEDVTALGFDDASLDVIASFDVLEHVPDYSKAMGEFARTLRAGGMLVLTVPFVSNIHATTTRARLLGDGGIEHLLPPEYHGDPLGQGGILCFYDFGWDLLDLARAAGFRQASMALSWAPGMGLMGHLWTLTAIR